MSANGQRPDVIARAKAGSMSKIDEIIAGILEREGGYVNHPADRGGETCWGITVGVARANGYRGEMKNMPRSSAEAIYRKIYITDPGFDKVLSRCAVVGEDLIDTGVNMGVAVAGTMLQRLLNALNHSERDYPDLKVDGDVGGKSLAALDAFRRVRGAIGDAVLLKGLDSLQGERYVDLAEKRPANEAFLFGWLRTRCR